MANSVTCMNVGTSLEKAINNTLNDMFSSKVRKQIPRDLQVRRFSMYYDIKVTRNAHKYNVRKCYLKICNLNVSK